MTELFDDRGRHVAALLDDGGDPIHLLEALCDRIPHSLYNREQQLVGSLNTGHNWIPLYETQVGQGCLAWVEETAEKEIVGVITWDGACGDQITGWYESNAIDLQAPRGKVMSWPRTNALDRGDNRDIGFNHRAGVECARGTWQ